MEGSGAEIGSEREKQTTTATTSSSASTPNSIYISFFIIRLVSRLIVLIIHCNLQKRKTEYTFLTNGKNRVIPVDILHILVILKTV